MLKLLKQFYLVFLYYAQTFKRSIINKLTTQKLDWSYKPDNWNLLKHREHN